MNNKAYKNYEIDEYEYNELKWFCWQYDKKKRKISNTENDSEKQKLKKEIEMIDTALMLVSDSDLIISLIKKNVTQKNMPYEKLGSVPMGRRQFYEKRRKFFWILKRLRLTI